MKVEGRWTGFKNGYLEESIYSLPLSIYFLLGREMVKLVPSFN